MVYPRDTKVKPQGVDVKRVQRPKPFGLRLEPELKSWMEVKARENRRSLNGEVAFVLEQYRRSQGKEQTHG
jgi:hypothetical protein